MMRFLDIKEDPAEIFALQKRNPSMINRLRWLNYMQSNLFSNIGKLAHIVGVEEEEVAYWHELYRLGGIDLLLDRCTMSAPRAFVEDPIRLAEQQADVFRQRRGQRREPPPPPRRTMMTGAFIASNVHRLEGESVKKNSKNRAECVELVRSVQLDDGQYVPPSWTWRQGDSVLGNRNIRWGTAVATFENGRFRGTRSTGQHSGFFLEHSLDGQGFKILEQFPGLRTIQIREIRPKGGRSDPPNNANCFSVIRAEIEIDR
jgi:hypothetical protein